MKLIKCPHIESEKDSTKIRVFVAGGITGCPDWQTALIDAVADLDGIIYNPRRDHFDVKNTSESVKQIEWEYNMMKKSHIVLFWFPKESVCPITLYELGVCNAIHPLHGLIVGTHQSYTRRLDVVEQSRLMGRDKIYDSLEELISVLRQKIRIYNYEFDLKKCD